MAPCLADIEKRFAAFSARAEDSKKDLERRMARRDNIPAATEQTMPLQGSHAAVGSFVRLGTKQVPPQESQSAGGGFVAQDLDMGDVSYEDDVMMPPQDPQSAEGNDVSPESEHLLPSRIPKATRKGKQPALTVQTNAGASTASTIPLSGGLRKSARASVVESAGKWSTKPSGKFLKADELPPADFGLVKVLVQGEPDEQFEPPNASQEPSLRAFWNENVGKERFPSWFNGKSPSCLNDTVVKKKPSVWTDGTGFACEDCVQYKRPCCRVVLDGTMKPVLVAVLPQSGKVEGERFKYWSRK